MSEESFEQLLKQIPRVAKAVNEFKSEQVQQAAFDALIRSLDVPTSHGRGARSGDGKQERTTKKSNKTAKSPSARSARKSKTGTSLVKDLNLRPKDKEPFRAFADSKGPKFNPEKCLVSVYYLKQIAGISGVSSNHVYTCFKDKGWRVPSDLENTLAWTSSQKGWLTTTDMEDIQLSTSGENHVEHDLPEQAKKATKKSK